MRLSRFTRFAPVLLAASGWIALAATALPPASPIRVLVSVAFLLLGPGTAAVLLANTLMVKHGTQPYRGLAALTVAVAVSLALGTLVSEAFALTGTFTMARSVIVLAALTTGLALIPSMTRLGGAQP
jgi:hypothetical protein